MACFLQGAPHCKARHHRPTFMHVLLIMPQGDFEQKHGTVHERNGDMYQYIRWCVTNALGNKHPPPAT